MLPTSIRLDDASVFFGKLPAVDGFTGAFTPGTVTALIGGDGAGKSTLLRLLAGRLSLHSGTSEGLPVDRRDVGYQPADSGVWRNLSVAENIEFVTRTYGIDPEQARTRSAELLALAGLDHVTGRLAGRLSGGMRQKLGVVLATLHRPGLVLLDEPTTGVDPISRAELWSLIAGAAANGATVVFATTYLDEAERASRLFLLGDGKLLAAGTPEDIIAHTPGVISQAPVALDVARRELASAHAWRRGDTVFRWEANPCNDRPEGFETAPGNLENTSIALLLDQDDAQLASMSVADRRILESRKTTGRPLVEAIDVARSYGTFNALGGVSLRVLPGEVVGLLGGNGAGKTTLMRILLGLETPTTGTATLFGEKPSLETRRRIGYVAQGLGLYPSLSAMENLEFAASVHGVAVNEQARDFAHPFGRNPISSLPLGTKRSLAYFAATLHDPELLVLDEPTSGMDALTRARLWRDLRAAADDGAGVLVTTHYMQEAAQCDRLVILTAGKVTAEGTVAEITSPHISLTVTTEHWEEAFTLLRKAGIPALLDGRTLRIPGADHDETLALLAPLRGEVTITESTSTLEETMMISALDRAST
ncbi:ATP-binding cassette domain-containing protein [Rarobacter incanus]|uniref:ABC-2 type transport system ATP-binding protein n=1 Tax=Rarobacter incanus TaxID=153494 RepID=A0A542SNW5_9MICO|nr:ATP-binding cassette domain-containing protein [Rarobacter incanus]TQK76303.1 ABC-2 type transport system ATP-binding protein [Rarobacter incanus]